MTPQKHDRSSEDFTFFNLLNSYLFSFITDRLYIYNVISILFIYMIVYYIYIYNHMEELSSDIGLKEIIYSSAFNFANGILYSVQES